MALLRSLLVPLSLVSLMLSAGACAFVPPVKPADIVAAVENLAGPSDMPPETRIEYMPYERPVPSGQKPVMVGNSEVYLYAYPDTHILVRPMSKGPQTFMFLTSKEAQSSFAMKLHLLPDTVLQKGSDGSVNIHDKQAKLSVPILKVPWAKTVDGRNQVPTNFEIHGDTVTQHIDLSHAKFPLVGDPEFDDPVKQIIEGRLPVLKDAETATKDGPSMSFPGGRYYAGPNGLEIRFTHEGSVKAVENVVSVEGVFITATTAALLSPIVAAALGGAAGTVKIMWDISAGIAGNYIDNDSLVDSYFLHGQCIGITIPRTEINGFDNLVAQVMSIGAGQIVKSTVRNIKTWLEPCNPADSTVKRNTITPSAPPAVNRSDTELAVPANPVTPTTKSSQAPTPQQGPIRVGPGLYNVDMNQACRIQYHNSTSKANVVPPGDIYSWRCFTESGTLLGSVSVRDYCVNTYYGSLEYRLNETASGWRCKVG